MLLTGTHPRTLDAKNRLALPKRIREQFGDAVQFFVAPGADKSLWIYTRAELERLAVKLDEISATDAETRVFRRLFFAEMEEAELDRAGRILIPDRLVAFAGLGHEVMLLGVRDHLELWNEQQWRSYHDQHSGEFDKFAEAAFRSK